MNGPLTFALAGLALFYGGVELDVRTPDAGIYIGPQLDYFFGLLRSLGLWVSGSSLLVLAVQAGFKRLAVEAWFKRHAS